MITYANLRACLERICPNKTEAKFLLAVSGGVDSMVLLHLFHSLNLNFQVAHINYGLRGTDSEKDEDLVRDICAQKNIRLHSYKVLEKDAKPKNSVQEWARNLRYAFFRKIQKEENLEFLVTAHHLNDELETFIINLSKASGLKGLSGIPQNENGILRPLLHFSKSEIYDFAGLNKIQFREDISNRKNDYLRNKIRNEIAPKLLETNENFLDNFGKSLCYLKAAKNLADEKISEIEREIIVEKDNNHLIDKHLLFQQNDFVQYEILKKFGFDHPAEIAKIKNAEKGKTFYSSEYEILVDRDVVIIKRQKTDSDEGRTEEFSLEIQNSHIILPENINIGGEEVKSFTWKIDGKNILFPLKMRQKKNTDVFQPIGMIGKKKISKFFKDEKIPILAQEKIWLLCDSADQVLGVFPLRQDGRFAASEKSEQVIKLAHPQVQKK